MTTAMAAATERQLEWSPGEVPGGEMPFAERRVTNHASATRSRWLAAALVVAASGAAFGIALVHGEAPAPATQEPVRDVEWTECHGPAALAAVAAGVTSLKCFDFDDAACAQLVRFTKLERLDLSGTDYAVPPRITDKGVRELGALTNLRWLCVARCHEMKGAGLQALEALPQLEHLDLTYSGVQSSAVERLQRLPSLRSLVLSHCPAFHGRSLAAVARIPGLRRLELRACPTLTAADAMHIAKLKELRHLDLRDCQGRFRGQREFLRGPDGKAPPEAPVEDGIGITDHVVAAIAAIPLETLLLGGCESLTDAIANPIARMSALRSLDLSNLPNVTGALLARVPDGLEALALDNAQFDAEALRRLPPLARVRELGLNIGGLDAATFEAVLANKQLTSLRLARAELINGGQPALVWLSSADLAVLAKQKQLRSLDLDPQLVDEKATAIVAALPQLTELDLSRTSLAAHVLAPLAACASLRSLKLTHAHLDLRALLAIPGAQLRELDLSGTYVPTTRLREAAKAWNGCTITTSDGQRWRQP
ncbi:MAG TPA: hypothetical protein VFT55_00355 [Planctomycetota bacterium]|nr:hypothetical protein [Planctomycetota bacterium]